MRTAIASSAHGITGQGKRQIAGVAFAQHNIFGGKRRGGNEYQNEDERNPFQSEEQDRVINNLSVKRNPFVQAKIRTQVPKIRR